MKVKHVCHNGLFTFIILHVFSSYLASQNYNRHVPPEFPRYEYEEVGTNFNQLIFLAPFNNTTPGNNYSNLGVLDENGYLLWYYQALNSTFFDFKPLRNHKIAYAKGNLLGSNTNFFILNSDFEPIDTLYLPSKYRIDIHELILLKSGNYMIGGIYDTIMDLRNFTFNGTPGDTDAVVTGFVLVELDSLGKTQFVWDAFDYIPFSEYYTAYGYNKNGLRYCQGNAIEEDTDGNIMVSFRVLNSIYKINKLNGKVIWKLGGKNSDFVFTNDNGFSAQHDIRRLKDGSISIYDNGNLNIPRVSRSVKFSLDTFNNTATKLWEYKYSDSLFASAMGNYQETTEPYKLINWGNLKRPWPSITVIDEFDDELINIYLEDGEINYRAFFTKEVSINKNRPQIHCIRKEEKYYLKCSTVHEEYLWSTGDTTSVDEVFTTGTYQLWVPHSFGNIGSNPIIIDDLNSSCTPVGIENKKPTENRKLIGTYNLLGQQIIQKVSGTYYLEVFDDGSTRIILHAQ